MTRQCCPVVRRSWASGLADVAAVRARGAEPLRGRVAEDDPERAGLRLGGAARAR